MNEIRLLYSNLISLQHDFAGFLLQIYIIKQDIHIYVPYNRPNGWTDWAKFFCGP